MRFDLDAIERQRTLTAALATKLQKHQRHLERQRDAYAEKAERVKKVLAQYGRRVNGERQEVRL